MLNEYEDPAGYEIHAEAGWAMRGDSSDGWAPLFGVPADPIEYGGQLYSPTFRMFVRRSGEERNLGVLWLLMHPDHQISNPATWCFDPTMDTDAFIAELLAQRKPLGWWKTRAWMSLALKSVLRERESGDLEAELSSDEVDLVRQRLAGVASVTQRRRRDRLTPSHLREVARVYREAWHAGKNPTRAVADHFDRQYSTASRWVVAARKSGELGPADGSRGGELEEPSGGD